MNGQIVRFPIDVIDNTASETGHGLLKTLAAVVGDGTRDVSTEHAASVAAIKNAVNNITFGLTVSNLGTGYEIFDDSTPIEEYSSTGKKQTIKYKKITTSDTDGLKNLLYVTENSNHIYINTVQGGDPDLFSRPDFTLNGGIYQEAEVVKIEDFKYHECETYDTNDNGTRKSPQTISTTKYKKPIFHNPKLDDTLGKILIRCEEAFHPNVSFSIGMYGYDMTSVTNEINHITSYVKSSNTPIEYNEALVTKFTASPTTTINLNAIPLLGYDANSNTIGYKYGNFFYDKGVYVNKQFEDKNIYIFLHLANGYTREAAISYGGKLSIVMFYDRSEHKQWSFCGFKQLFNGDVIESDAIWSYNLTTNIQTKLRATCSSRSKCMQIQNNAKSFLVGGMSNLLFVANTEKFEFSTETSSFALTDPYSDTSGSSASHKNKGVLFYGHGHSTGLVFDQCGIKYFDYANEMLTDISNSESKMFNIINSAACSENYELSDNIYLYGGAGYNLSGGTLNTSCFVLNLANDVIQSQSGMSFSRVAFDMVSDFKKLYIFGGHNSIGYDTNIYTYAFNTSTIVSYPYITMPIQQDLVSQCSKMNSAKTEIIIVAKQCVQRINITVGVSSISTEFNPLDATTGMVCASSHTL